MWTINDLEGHARSLKMVLFDRPYHFTSS